MLLSVSVFADGPETPDEGEPAAVETASETAETVDLPAADAAIETAAAAVETANEVLETLEAIAPETTEETDTSSEAIEAAAEAGDLDALAAIVEAAAESAKADAETAKAAAETTQTAADALQEQVETGTFEYISDETEFDAVDEESGETYTTTGQELIESAKEVAAAANEAAENAEVASENAANAADAAQYALENADEPATEEQQQVVDTAKEAAADAADKAETAKAAAAEVEAVIETATATAEEAAEIVARAADAAKDAAVAANNAAVAAKDAANTIAIIRNVDETHTEDEVDAAKAVVVEKVERAVELAKVADEKAEIAKEAAARAKDVTLSGKEKAEAIATAAKAAKEATIAANEAADAANEAADAAWELAEQKGWPFYQKVVTAKGVIVTARAQAGVFPKGTELTAEDVEPEQVEEQMDVAASDVVTAVDINFWLGEAKIQPDTSKGLVDVTITDPNADTEGKTLEVATVKDGETETIKPEVDDEGVVAFAAEHFTTYAITVAEQLITVIVGDETNPATEKTFVSLQAAINAIDGDGADAIVTNGANVIVRLPDAGVDIGANSLAIDKALTLEGGKLTSSVSAGNAAIIVTNSGAITIKCDVTATKGHGIQAGTDSAAYFGKLTVNGATITVAQRGIRVYKEDTGFGIELSGATIQSNETDPKTTYTTGDNAMGLSLGTTDNKGYTVTITNSTIQGFSYCINSTTSGSYLTVNMTGGATYGRAALNVWGGNCIFTLDGVHVYGLNNEKGSTEAFSCIVDNYKDYSQTGYPVLGNNKNKFVIKDCEFEARLSSAAATTSGSTASEQLIDLRGPSSIAIFEGNVTYTAKVGSGTITLPHSRFGLLYSEGCLADNIVEIDSAAMTSLASVLAALSNQVSYLDPTYLSSGKRLAYTPDVYYWWNTQTGTAGGVLRLQRTL